MFRKLEFEPIVIQVLYKHFRGGSEAMLILLIYGVGEGGGVQNSGKPAYIILARSLTV